MSTEPENNLLNPVKIIKISVLFLCGIFTIIQLKECVDKLQHPPISTHYRYFLNNSIKYPCVTICRRPPFKSFLFPTFGLSQYANLETQNVFNNFNFSRYTLSEFMEATTYNFSEIALQYAYAGQGSNPNLSIKESYHLNRGRCHTIQPLVESEIFSISGGYLFFFGHDITRKTLDDYGIATSGFRIYLHQPSEVVSYKDDQKDSFLDEIYLESSEDLSILLNVKEFHQVPSRDNPCIPEESYSKSRCQQQCVNEQLALKYNCTTPWLQIPPTDDLPECNNLTILRSLNREFRNSNLITVMQEILGYDWNQFVSDVGGSLGFLLGLSVLSLIYVAEEICGFAFRWAFARKLKKKQTEELNENNGTENANNVEPEKTDNEKDNKLKKEDNQVIADKHDYKHLKDFVTDYRFYENNLFNDKTDDNKKY